MKFAKTLEDHSVPEWRKAYINYKGLKKRLRVIEKENENRRPVGTSTSSFISSKRMKPPRAATSAVENRPWAISSQRTFSSSFLNRFRSNNANEETLSQHTAGLDQQMESSVLDEFLRQTSESEKQFFTMLDDNLNKISDFYDEKEKEAIEKYEALRSQVQLIHQYNHHASHTKGVYDVISSDNHLNPINWFKTKKSADEILPIPDPSVHYNGKHHMNYHVARNRVKKATTEFYRSLELLKSYKDLNETGFRKILKKYDKTTNKKISNAYLRKIKNYHWIKSDQIHEIFKKTENLFIDEFAEGHRRRGMAKLRIPEKDEHYTMAIWRIGFFIGLSVAIFGRVIELALQVSLPNILFNYQIYACFGVPVLFCLGFAVNIVVWHRCHINYKFIFEFDPRDNLNHHEFAELPALMLFLISIIMYIDLSQCFAPAIPSELCPLILFVILVAIIFCPFPILYYSSRRWLIISLGRIVLSFVFSVEFRDFFIADELNSLAYSFWTMSYFFCSYGWHWDELSNHCSIWKYWYTPLIASLPPWWRFLQCIRRYKDSKESVHIYNGLKYTTSILATLVTGYRRIYGSNAITIVWILSCILNSSYTSFWDIKKDWGLLEPYCKNFLLRKDIVFYKWTYYLAMPINVLLRFSWVLNFASGVLARELLWFVIAMLEVYRRLQWNFFRMENEHLNNCGNYRAIKEIPLPFSLDNKSTSNMEEGNIRLPSSPTDITAPPAVLTATSDSGNFYGRRDFENRHNVGDPKSTISNHRGSVLELFTRLKSSSSDDSDLELDDELSE